MMTAGVSPPYCAPCPPFGGLRCSLRKGHYLPAPPVTARTGVDEAIQAWLAERDIEYDTFHSLPHTETKAALGYDACIDDKPGLADELAADQCQYLVRQPWNRPAWRHEWTVTVASVVEAVDRLLANTGEL